MKARTDRLKVEVSVAQLGGKPGDSAEAERLDDRDAAAAAAGGDSGRG